MNLSRQKVLVISLTLATTCFLTGCNKPGVTHTKAPYLSAKTFTNSLRMKFIEIPAGEFMMGSNKYSGAQPVHKVTMSSFYMMTTEVTNEQYEQFKKRKVRGEYSKKDKAPATELYRREVFEFIDWLSKRDGIEYALPTEAQWEYAARGGLEGMDYPWGNQFDDKKALVGSTETMPVGSYPPNNYGLYDMCGNAWEMIREVEYSYSPKNQKDPIGPLVDSSSDPFHLERGAGVRVLNAQIWMRSIGIDNLPSPTTGFRLVIIGDPQNSDKPSIDD